jgi:hypothetical protein
LKSPAVTSLLCRLNEELRVKLLLVVILWVFVPCSVFAQDSKIPISVAHTGKDEVGAQFAEALSRQISASTHYKPMPAAGTENGLRFYVDLITLDSATALAQQGKRSAISVVVEDMGLPNSFPVPNMWYHKVIVVDSRDVENLAKTLLEDMDARWCRQLKNSVGGCPKEKLDPKVDI